MHFGTINQNFSVIMQTSPDYSLLDALPEKPESLITTLSLGWLPITSRQGVLIVLLPTLRQSRPTDNLCGGEILRAFKTDYIHIIEVAIYTRFPFG